MPEQFDLVAIGDVTSDAFIKIREAEVHCDEKGENCKIAMRFGDKIPFESVTIVAGVGNSPNAAVSAARLGLKSALVSNLGKDYHGEEAIAALIKNRVNTDWVKKHDDIPTNYHYVLWYKDDRTILIKHEQFPYSLPNIGSPKWVYLSSLGENSLPFHHEIGAYLAKHPEIKLAFQPGTFQIKLGKTELADIYKVTEIFFCNVEEAKRILETREEDIKKLIVGMSELGPKVVVITDATRGAYAFQNGKAWFMPPYPDPKPPLERTGAGDSFASTFTAALVLDKSVPEALRWAPINSMSVVQYVGAQEGLLTREKLEQFLAQAPADYKPKEI
jgi:ribokinase